MPEDLSRFADEISRYPLEADHPIVYAAGYGNWIGGEFEYEYLRLQVHPLGSLGQVGFVVNLAADEVVPHPSLPPAAIRHQAQLEIMTTYERLRDFSRRLKEIADGRAPEARIEEEWLG